MTAVGAALVFRGRGVSDGVAIGTTALLQSRDHEVFRFPVAESAIEDEVARFHEAVAQTRREIQRTGEQVRRQVGEDLAGVFDAYDLILCDELYAGAIETCIRTDQVNAEWAVHRTATALGERFARIESEHLRERGDDLRDVTRYLFRALQGISHHELSEIAGGVIVIADELTPSEALRLGRQGIVGLALEGGGPNSHTAIVARALSLPLIVGVGPLGDSLRDRQVAVLDGRDGTLIIEPDAATLERYRAEQRALTVFTESLARDRDLPAVTLDGAEVELLANIEFPDEIAEARRYGARGIGLYRSEFLYIEKSPNLPSEDEHCELFRTMLEQLAPHPVIVRTFDLGGRKLAREVMDVDEENPSLGLRGIRLTLARPKIFRTQLRALFRAAVHGDLWIMVPLVSCIEEVRQFREFCKDVVSELAREGVAHRAEVPLGAMVEVPAAVWIADHLARELDFLSIGTNDLIQYTLAVDRSNEHVASLYQPLHPAILHALRRVADAGADGGARISVCGEMAANPRYAPVLVGAGLRHLSMSPLSIPLVKDAIRRLDAAAARELYDDCLRLSSASEIESRLAQWESSLALSGS
ncbi:MAG TPA: phosphoenolpyruvate--protein phosphotransferase [Thermoanaerobaculia bacterium]|nr:phosphoenolpyruvate--protein phosphotransferase [Thermoanaerobaculia bacterium]